MITVEGAANLRDWIVQSFLQDWEAAAVALRKERTRKMCVYISVLPRKGGKENVLQTERRDFLSYSRSLSLSRIIFACVRGFFLHPKSVHCVPLSLTYPSADDDDDRLFPKYLSQLSQTLSNTRLMSHRHIQRWTLAAALDAPLSNFSRGYTLQSTDDENKKSFSDARKRKSRERKTAREENFGEREKNNWLRMCIACVLLACMRRKFYVHFVKGKVFNSIAAAAFRACL